MVALLIRAASGVLNVRIEKALALLLVVGAMQPTFVSAATLNLIPGENLTRAVEVAADGDIIQLANGTYTATGTYLGDAPIFNVGAHAINKRVTIRGNVSNPSLVVLQGTNGAGAVQFLSYIDGFDNIRHYPNQAVLEGVTIQGPGIGVLIDDYSPATTSQRLSGITIRNVIIQASNGTGLVTGGVSNVGTNRLVLDNVTVSATNGIGFELRDAEDTLLMNSEVNSAAGTLALFVNGGQRNVIVNNILGKAPTTNGTTLTSTGVAIMNSSANRFELNTIQGHSTDGVAFYNSPSGITTRQALDNYAGKNKVLSNGWAATKAGIPNRDHGTGMWVYCSANNTWLFGNDVSGGPEAGLTIWTAKSNAFIANASHDNEDGGVFISGGTDLYTGYCTQAQYQIKSTRNTVQSNAIFYNKDDNIIIRNSDYTDLFLNHITRLNGFNGTPQECNSAACQSAFAFDGPTLTLTGNRVLRNTTVANPRGLWVDDGNTRELEFFGNRMIGTENNRLIQPSTFTTLDWGSTLGGNHWSQHTTAGGNPGTTAFTSISDSPGNVSTGYASDRYPYQSESFAITQLSVAEPYAGDYAIGSARTVRWNGLGCSWVDILLDGATAVKSNAPNTGYAVVTIPSTTEASHYFTVACKNSSGQLTGVTANSPAFNVKSSNLKLLAPGRDDVFNGADLMAVAWARTNGFAGAVDIEFSTDNFATLTPLATGVTGNFAFVNVPTINSTAKAKIRITSGTLRDTVDGVFAVRGASGAGFTNVTGGRSLTMGRLERLEWASPINSRLVTITYAGAKSGTVVTDFPDRGSYDWIVPDIGTTSNLVFTITFKNSTGSAIGSPVASNAAASVYPGATGSYILSVTAVGSGTVTSVPPGINCPPACDFSFAANENVALSAAAGTGSSFFGWSGSCTGTTCTVNMSANKGVSAGFYTGTLAVRYRLYSPDTFEHLATTNVTEYLYLTNQINPGCCGWTAEGPDYNIFSGPGSFGGVAAVPYYRLYNKNNFQHHWTTDLVEYNFLPQFGWEQEGPDGYILKDPVPGAIPLFRLYNPCCTGPHLWTKDANENSALLGLGWQSEGIAGYVLPLQ
jgi:hypothetical protein